MVRNPAFATLADLPEVIPIFPLAGVLLLPGGALPLNIFEPRYLAMTEDALKTDHRLIGMIQPTGGDDAEAASAPGRPGPEVFRTGCAGRMVGFTETGDGRYLINLLGVTRFHVGEELELRRGYRRIKPDYSDFAADLEPGGSGGVDRDQIDAALERYFAAQNINPDWSAIRKMRDRDLVTFLAMGCPFGPPEKQALLEATDLQDCSRILLTLLEMSGSADSGGEGTRH